MIHSEYIFGIKLWRIVQTKRFPLLTIREIMITTDLQIRSVGVVVVVKVVGGEAGCML